MRDTAEVDNDFVEQVMGHSERHDTGHSEDSDGSSSGNDEDVEEDEG
jgi:hypothetical protein